jgi:hypothetical protein
MQDDKLPPDIFENGLRDRNSPMCTLSQHGYGAQRAKARKYTCLLPVDKITALRVHGAKTRSVVVTRGAGERWSSGIQDATLPYTVRLSATKMHTGMAILSLLSFMP